MALRNSDVRYMIRKANKKLKVAQFEIRYKDAGGSDIGYGGSEDTWSEWQLYWASSDTIDEFNINQFEFGDIGVGDLVLMIPKDTPLPPDKIEYEFKINDTTYRSKTGLRPTQSLHNTFLYYLMVGEVV